MTNFTEQENELLAKIDEISAIPRNTVAEHYMRLICTKDFILHLLEFRNNENRYLSPATTKRYLADIQLANWHFNAPLPIVLGRDGIILDGQHRLQAYAEHGESVSLAFLLSNQYETPLNTPFDLGKKRRIFEVISRPKEATCIITRIIARGLRVQTPSVSQINDYYDLLYPPVERVLNAANVTIPGCNQTILQAVVALLYARYGEETIIDRYKHFLLGDDSLKGLAANFRKDLGRKKIPIGTQFTTLYSIFDPSRELRFQKKIPRVERSRRINKSVSSWFAELR